MAGRILKTQSAITVVSETRDLKTWFARLIASPVFVLLCLTLILLGGALFRFTGLNWDENQHLHPDERFLTMVAANIQWPADLTLSQYFDTENSPLNPYNHNFDLYVYGTFPLFLLKRVAIWLGQTEFNQIHLVGRALSGIFDLGAIFFLFLTGRRLYGSTVALLGAALLAMTVLQIQHAHFFVVDTFANFFVVATVYFAVRVSESGRWSDYALLGLGLGAGVASKISVFTLAAVAILASGLYFYRSRPGGESSPNRASSTFGALRPIVIRLVVAAAISLHTFHLLQPIAFQGPGIFDFTPNEQWLANMHEVRALVSGQRDIPPGHQWTDRTPLWFPWKNMVLWGLGLPLGLAAWAGFVLAAYELFRRQRLVHLLPVAYISLVFLHQGTQWVKSLRYLMPIYPFLALLAGYLLVRVWDWASSTRQPGGFLSPRRLAILLVGGVMGGTLAYAIAFTSIYTRSHSRIQASHWIYEHIPEGATLAIEHWDDGLPLHLDGFPRDHYQFVTLKNYDEDTPQKLEQLVYRLNQADYILLSSNRLYDSIPRLPLRYPMTTRYYDLLLAEKLGFKKVVEFTSYPQIFGLELPDQSAEEAFTVYDHPKVMIFQKSADFDLGQVYRILNQDIDWAGIIKMWPVQATKAPTALMLSEADRQTYSRAGTWSTLFNRSNWANRFPVIAWFLALVALGLIAWPITFITFSNFVDRGYILSKAVGLLLLSWLAWLLASSRLLPFSLAAIGTGLALLALISTLMLWARRQDFIEFARARWRLILTTEALFWGLFLMFVLIRWNNPDLWHPERGGEKPMDFAYLNAVVRSAYFPPYDPWLAGGFINYYYFGFVLVAVLVKLTGVVPAVAYNLAVPTFFAMTAMGAFTATFNLAAGRGSGFHTTDNPDRARWGDHPAGPAEGVKSRAPPSSGRPGRPLTQPILAGLLAILFVAVIGNLGQARLLWTEIQPQGQVKFVEHARQGETVVSGLSEMLDKVLTVTRTPDGLGEPVANGRIPSRPEKWYWDASRIIPHPQNEAGPITEFPFFTFLFADLHAHMMALPYTLLLLALAINLISDTSSCDQAHSIRRPAGHLRPAWPELLRLSLLALTLGALWPMNTWDFPTYAILVAAALALREFGRRQLYPTGHLRLSPGALGAVAWRWGLILGLGYLFFWPFHHHYASPYGGFALWQGSRTPLSAYLTIHGFFIFLIVTYLLLELSQGSNHNNVLRGLQHWSHLGRLRHGCQILARPWPGYKLMLGFIGVLLLLIVAILGRGYGLFALALSLMALTVTLLFRSWTDLRRGFILILIGLGLILTLLVELIVLEGDISRMNTVFKFYLQVWVLWGVATAACMPLIAARLSKMPGRVLRRLWWPAFAVLLAAGWLYPLLATRSRIDSRIEAQVGKTLDGTAYMAQAVYWDQGQEIILAWDQQAIEWLQTNVDGSPVIVEANTPIYRWGSRVSANTGLPTVIGWDWHQKQQRAILPADVIERRQKDVETIYTDPDPKTVHTLLRRYGVKYVYLGPLERLYYGSDGLPKFAEHARQGVGDNYWDLVYENPGVKIYQVRYDNAQS